MMINRHLQIYLGTCSVAAPRSMAAPPSQFLQNARNCLGPSGNDRWCGVRGEGDAQCAQPPTVRATFSPEERPIGEPNGRAGGSAPGANSIRSMGGGFARGPAGGVLPRAFLSTFALYPVHQLHRFMTILPFKNDSNGPLRPVLTRSIAALRLRPPGRPLLSFLNGVFPPYGEG